MIRVTPTKLSLKAEDLTEYERHKLLWSDAGRVRETMKSEKAKLQDEAAAQRNAVRDRLGIKPTDR